MLLELCAQLGIPAQVRRGTVAELLEADEVLLASSVRGVAAGRRAGRPPAARRPGRDRRCARPSSSACSVATEVSPARARRGALVVGALQALCVALVVGWFATGHASAPDSGLLQLDVITLDEPVEGLGAVGGRPTMVVLTCPSRAVPARTLDARYGFAVSTDPDLARRVALPRAASCSDGYVLLDASGHVRYRSYDPGWSSHDEEQEILLEAVARRSGHEGGHG